MTWYSSCPRTISIPSPAPDISLFQPQSGGSLITYLFNKNQGPFANVKLRQAFNLALDVHQTLLAGYSDPRFFKEGPSLGFPDQVDWYSDAGRALLESAQAG
jgi:peptide/nickel transport system substrate-binding protein